MFTILTVFSMAISAIVLANAGVFGGSRRAGGSPPKDEGILKNG